MTIEVSFEQNEMRVTALIITNNVATHSAIQEIPKEEVENIKRHIKQGLELLTYAANSYRKP